MPSKDENCSLQFQQMLDAIRAEFDREKDKVDVDTLWQILENYKSDPSEWSKFTFYDKYRYKRNLVEEHERYDVMILGWAPNVRSGIHDHSGSHCIFKVLEGELVESRFAWPEEGCRRTLDGSACTCKEMSLKSETHLMTDEVLYINDKVGLHCVKNPNAGKTCATLHIYFPPIRRCKTFDQKTGKSEVCKLTFHSKRGQMICEDEAKC